MDIRIWSEQSGQPGSLVGPEPRRYSLERRSGDVAGQGGRIQIGRAVLRLEVAFAASANVAIISPTRASIDGAASASGAVDIPGRFGASTRKYSGRPMDRYRPRRSCRGRVKVAVNGKRTAPRANLGRHVMPCSWIALLVGGGLYVRTLIAHSFQTAADLSTTRALAYSSLRYMLDEETAYAATRRLTTGSFCSV